jgi:hypothetical protein
MGRPVVLRIAPYEHSPSKQLLDQCQRACSLSDRTIEQIPSRDVVRQPKITCDIFDHVPFGIPLRSSTRARLNSISVIISNVTVP